MKKQGRWIVLGTVVLILLVLLGWASSLMPSLSRTSEEWSRGRSLGQTPVKRPVALRPAPGGGVFLVWPNRDDQLEMAHVGADGEVLLDRVLPLDVLTARDPQLQVGVDGRLHLLWREQGQSGNMIRYALLGSDGVPLSQSRLSGPTAGALGAPRLAWGADGRLHALWADEVGVRWAVLGGGGGILGGPALVVPEGTAPIVQTDASGRLHLLWQQWAEGQACHIRYATLDPETGELGDLEEIAEIVLSGSLRLQGVALSLGPDTGYVLWSEYNSKFDHYHFGYASFPLGAPQEKRVGHWQLQQGDGPEAIASLDGQQSSPLVALSERMVGPRQDFELQIALIIMGREDVSERSVTSSSQASLEPTLVVDGDSHPHLAWLETAGFGDYGVVYASMAPGVMENYNALTLWDALDAVFGSVFQVSTVLVAVILSLTTWAVVPLMGLVVYHVVTGEETLDTMRSRAAIAVTLAVEVGLSFALPSRFGLEAVWPGLRWVAPVVAATVAAVATAWFLRRQAEKHLFLVFFLFTAVNCVLQVLLYLLF
jgi:hypothetical protein